jgi:ATP-dependent phosphofructokinase / diphosphate-dependent phosphofructokinase
MKIGILTGGGDAPGLNGIIESAAKSLLKAGHSLLGIQDGFEGIFDQRTINITREVVEGIHSQAGTLLGTSNKSGTKGREEEFLSQYKALALDGLIVAGGDGTFSGLKAFASEVPIIGVPKTIDNDLQGTDFTFGYDTAVGVVADAVDALRSTANAHRRIIVVETMGRTAGWIALGGGLASYADVILIPERPFSKAQLLEFVRSRQKKQRGLLIVVSEGAHAAGEDVQVAFEVKGSPEALRLGGIAALLARWLEKETGWEARQVVLGHLQRAEHPSPTDRFLTVTMGTVVSELVAKKKWGSCVVYRQGRVTHAPLEDIMGPPRVVAADHHWLRIAQELGSFI